MFRSLHLALVLTVGLAWSANPGAAQEERDRPAALPGMPEKPLVVRDRSSEFSHVFGRLAKYPQAIRDAVPILAQHPDLTTKLADLAKKNEFAYIEQILAKHPKEVRSAARTLCQSPDALEVMALHVNLMRVVGDIRQKDGPAVLQTIVQEVKDGQEASAEAMAAWVELLRQNPAALRRYLEARTVCFQAPVDGDFLGCGFGLAYNAKENLVTVYALPPKTLTMQVMAHADRYPELADIMLEQWLHTDSYTAFDKVVAQSYAVMSQLYPQEFFHPKGRAERLRAFALLAKRVSKDYGEGKLTAILDHPKALAEHAAAFPALAGFAITTTGLAQAEALAVVEKPQVPRMPTLVARVEPVERAVRKARVVPKLDAAAVANFQYYWMNYAYQPWWGAPIFYMSYRAAVAQQPRAEFDYPTGEAPLEKYAPTHSYWYAWYNYGYAQPLWYNVPYAWPYYGIKPWWWWRAYYPGYYRVIW